MNFKEFVDPIGIFDSLTGKSAQEAFKRAEGYGEQSEELANNWKTQLHGMINPYMQAGNQAYDKSIAGAEGFLNQQVPAAYQHNPNGIQALYQSYMQGQNTPQYISTNAPVKDYQQAANSGLYKQLMDQASRGLQSNAAAQGLSTRGAGHAYNMANAAKNANLQAADQLYQNDLNQYQLAQQNNRLRDQQLSNQYQAGQGLQSYLNQLHNQNYGNQLNQYNNERQNILSYLAAQNNATGLGMNALSQFAGHNTNAIGSQLSTLAGLANNEISSQAAKDQGVAGGLNVLGGVVSMFSDRRLKENIKDTGHRTKDGIKYIVFDWKAKAKALGDKYGLNLAGRDIGVDAQEVESKRPDLISWVDGFRVVNYGGL